MPVFEFGHGLHYTNFTAKIATAQSLPSSFATKNLTAKSTDTKYADLLPFTSIPVTVTNVGSVTSDYVLLAFLKGQYGPQPYPRKSLVGFTRLRGIAGGASATTSLDIALGSVARSDDKGNLVLFPGNYSVVLDIDGRDAWSFSISGDPVTLDQLPARPNS